MYVDGEVGELWVLRTKEGNIEVVSSNFQPNHSKWPGKTRGWPEPSVEYQRELWAIHKRNAETNVETYKELLDELSSAPLRRGQQAWDLAKVYNKQEVEIFKGPDDPAYLEYLRSHYTEGLKRSKEKLKDIIKSNRGYSARASAAKVVVN